MTAQVETKKPERKKEEKIATCYPESTENGEYSPYENMGTNPQLDVL
jgi:hypothetical protein